MTSDQKLSSIKNILSSNLPAEQVLSLLSHLTPKLKSISAWQQLSTLTILLSSPADPEILLSTIKSLLNISPSEEEED